MATIVNALKNTTLIAFACVAAVAHAQQKPLLPGNYPNKPMRVVVSGAPGGSTDFAARLKMGKLSELWDSPFVVDNRGGAIGAIGVDGKTHQKPEPQNVTQLEEIAWNGQYQREKSAVCQP